MGMNSAPKPSPTIATLTFPSLVIDTCPRLRERPRTARLLTSKHGCSQEGQVIGLRPAAESLARAGQNRIEQWRTSTGILLGPRQERRLTEIVFVRERVRNAISVEEEEIASGKRNVQLFPCAGGKRRRDQWAGT